MIEIITSCPFCHKEHIVTAPFEGYVAWQSGEMIQDALPMLSSDEREMLISGICPTCWANMFSEDEDEDYYEDDNLEDGFDPYEGCYTYDC